MREYLWADGEFGLFQALIKSHLGISLQEQKKALVANRLWKRLQALNIDTFREYFQYINDKGHQQELQSAMELITTNETFFFREQKHFDYLSEHILPSLKANQEFCVWSAACSIGQEAYSIAMILADQCNSPWRIMASDVNDNVIEQGRRAIYQDVRTELIPMEYRRRYCRKGTGPYEGDMRIVSALRDQVEFRNINLIQSYCDIETFDLIFLRNVMIYFNDETKKDILNRIYQKIKPGGYLFVGHSESLHGLNDELSRISPAIYQRPLND